MYRTMIKIAWASLKRRKTRSGLVVLMIAVSLWGLLLMEGIYDGMTEQMIDNAIRSDCGDITIYAKDYRLDNDLNKLITNPNRVADLLNNDKRVKSHVSRLRQDGLIATANYSRFAAIYGINPAQEIIHSKLDSYITQGVFNFGKKKKGVILGARLADKLKITLGKKIILSAQNNDNEISSFALKVTGIIKTNNMRFDEVAAFIDQQKARELFLVPVGVTQFNIILHKEKDITALQNDLQSAFSHLDIFSWSHIYPALMQGRQMMEGFNAVTSLLVFAVAGLGIFGVMLVSVLERMREFGIMLAIGTKFSQVRQIIIFESLFLGLTGYICGSILGGTTLYYFYVAGLDLTIFSEGIEAFGMDTVTYAIIRPIYFISSFLAVTFATLASVIFPLRILKRTKPIEAIVKN